MCAAVLVRVFQCDAPNGLISNSHCKTISLTDEGPRLKPGGPCPWIWYWGPKCTAQLLKRHCCVLATCFWGEQHVTLMIITDHLRRRSPINCSWKRCSLLLACGLD